MKIRIIIIITVLSISCNTTAVKVKPQPSGENMGICPLCKGSGIAEIYDNKGALIYDDYDADSYFCMLPFGLLSGSSDGKRHPRFENDEQYNYPLEKKDDKRLMDENSLPQRSMIKRKVKCPRCEGAGWIKLPENLSPGYSDENRYDELYKTIDGE